MAGLWDRIEQTIDTNTHDIFNHTLSVLHEDIYKLNDEFYEGYQWIAALDSTTCLVCASLDNQIFDDLPGGNISSHDTKATVAPEQPLHPNCRCYMVPILIGDRKNAQSIPNYKEWFEGQKDDVKLDILGPSRYKEYLNGKPITGFVNDKYKIISLKELGISRTTRKELLEESQVKPDFAKPIKKDFNFDELKVDDIENIIKEDNYKYKITWDSYKDKTKEELILELKDRYGFNFSGSKNMDVEVVRNMVFNIAKVEERFPGLLQFTSNLQCRPSKAYYNRVFAYFNPNNKSIHITTNEKNISSWIALTDLYNRTAKNRLWPSGGNGTTPIIHEWGHLFHTLFNNSGLDDNKITKIIGFTVNRYGGIEDKIAQKVKEYYNSKNIKYCYNFVTDNLSKYANKSNEEFISEAFSEYITSSNPRPIAKIVGNIMLSIWRDYSGFL